MLVSKNSRCVGLIASALLLSILLTPTNLVAQKGKPTKADAYYKEVWAKLEAAIAAGKLTKEDALKKMEAIKKAAAEKNNFKKGSDKKNFDKKSAFPKGAAVKKGDYKKEAFKKGAYSMGHDTAVSLHLEAVWVGLRGLVAAGKMPQQEAKAIMGAIKKLAASSGKNVQKGQGFKSGQATKSVQKGKAANAEVDVYFQNVWAELQAAVKAGKLTKEQAVEKMTAIKKGKLGAK